MIITLTTQMETSPILVMMEIYGTGVKRQQHGNIMTVMVMLNGEAH